MKKNLFYEEATIEILVFQVDDILTTSTPQNPWIDDDYEGNINTPEDEF